MPPDGCILVDAAPWRRKTVPGSPLRPEKGQHIDWNQAVYAWLGPMTRSAADALGERAQSDPLAQRPARTELARLRALGRSSAILWPPIEALARSLGRPLRISTLADDDVAEELRQRANGRGVALEIRETKSPDLVTACHGVPIEPCATETYDVVLASFVLHRLTEDQAIGLLRRMATAAGSLVIVNDVTRSRTSRLLAGAVARLVSRSPRVHAEAVNAFRTAFTTAELRVLAAAAGMQRAVVQRRWPCQMLLEWRK